MLFRFRNIGKIAEADIEINGLTVLGGHNDTGKSTIGKTLYSIVKAINISEIEYKRFKIKEIEKVLSDLDIFTRKTTGHHGMMRSLSPMISYDKDEFFKALSAFYENIKEYRENIEEKTETEVFFKQAIEKINKIEQDRDDSSKYQSAFINFNHIMFRGEFINKKCPEMPSEIICSNIERFLFNIVVESSVSTKFNLIENNFIFEDVTLIESPIILSLFNLPLSDYNATGMILDTYYNHNIIDLMKKINYSRSYSYKVIDALQKTFMDQISNIIEGKVYYDEKIGDYIFKQGSELKIQSTNIASGIKSFGIIQLLIASGAINPNTLLIIDEPEVHLHPEWQLKYAELIAKLVDSGVYVLISSHSPYMIEALKVYSDKLKLDKITRFYVGNAHEKGTIFQDVTEDMEPLFHQLAFPMQKLTFEA